ncbi:rhombosortase [Rariglobus hedericola]|uniref:Rhombosortase n=1 Tax=Rariglobus hedericola TaxID=2597822 RepID=A0A556QQA4_9BACT|nr:rhombosortase [Rariglobus hedericola]TSJ78792.1 rhombosortase [Rariglobus hedericola]
MKRLPWSTLTVSVLAVIIHFVPALGNVLQFDRAAVAHGQVWRFFSAHLTHFGDDHLRWDLLAFVILGAMAERISRRAFLLTLGVSALIISTGVWVAQPQFTTYRGLSGIDSALFSFVIADLLATGWRERHRFSLIVGVAALGGFLAKCVFEVLTGNTVFVEAGEVFAPVPLAHLLGGAVGAAVVMWQSVRHRAIQQPLQLRGADRLQ